MNDEAELEQPKPGAGQRPVDPELLQVLGAAYKASKRDEEGYFYFMDRVKDYIRRRGENVSSMEVEKQVSDHPQIKEAAAIGGGIDWSDVRTFNLDEFVGLGGDDPGSYRAFMHAELFDHVGLVEAHTTKPGTDIEEAAIEIGLRAGDAPGARHGRVPEPEPGDFA